MGESTISMAIVNSRLLVYQAGCMILTPNSLWPMICSTQRVVIENLRSQRKENQHVFSLREYGYPVSTKKIEQ